MENDKLYEFNTKFLDLIDEYKNEMPAYEIVNAMIVQATGISLCCAPNEMVGIKAILTCIENGISHYEETHS